MTSEVPADRRTDAVARDGARPRVAGLCRRVSNPRGAENSLFNLFARLNESCATELFATSTGDSHRGDPVTTDVSWLSRGHRSSELGRVVRILQSGLLFRRLSSFDPDLIVSQHELSVLGSVYSRLTGTPQVLLLHGYEFTGDGDDSSVAKRRVIEWLFETANLVVANSDYVAAQYDDGIVDAVVRPFVDPSRYRVPTDGDAILHVTATRRKGIDVTLAIADRLPNEEFVVVGEASRGVERRLAHRSNVTYRGFVPDMASVYADAKLVLMPSVWAEPYGMVPVEAGVSGIPTLGSGRGGLSESIGHSDLIVDSNDPDDYIDRIDRVLSDYEKYSRIVTERAESRASTERVRRTRRLVARHTSVDL